MATITAADRARAAHDKHQTARPFLFLNPESGAHARAHKLEDILAALAACAIEPEVCVAHPHEAEPLVREAVKRGVSLVIAAGGDGTVEWVARGLFGSGATLGILPVGTENNVAQCLSLPLDLPSAARVIATGETRAVDAGMVNGFLFLETLGVGLEAELMPIGNQMRTPNLTALTALARAIATLLRFRARKITLRLDGQRPIKVRALQVNVSNVPRFGLHFDIAPEATVTDGRLDVVYLDTTSKWALLRYLLASRRGRPSQPASLHLHQAATIAIQSKARLRVHADKIDIGTTPVTVKVAAAALPIRLPAAAPQRAARGERADEASGAQPAPQRMRRQMFRVVGPAALLGLGAAWLMRNRRAPRRRTLIQRATAMLQPRTRS